MSVANHLARGCDNYFVEEEIWRIILSIVRYVAAA